MEGHVAIEAIFTKQFPVVCTPEQRDAIEAEAQRDRVSMAVVVRRAINARFGLPDGEHQG